MLPVADALKILLEAVPRPESAMVPLDEALGLRLADRVVADRDFPPADRSAMDGFAVRSADCAEAGRSLVVTGEIRAGHDPRSSIVREGESVRIFTGGVIPRGADAVVMVELTAEDCTAGTVVVNERPQAGQHVRRQGEDVRSGAVVVETETIVRTAEIAALAAVGCKRVSVFRPPHVSVLSTGDELVEVESAPADHQVRNSNARMLVAQLRAMQIHARNLGIARDDTAALDAMLEEGLRSEVFILSGGVSVGAYDLVGAALIRAGCEILFHNVSMRPGKPILAAKRGSCLIFGLPGNPLSAFTGCRVFVLPVLRRLMGDSKPVPPMVPATLGAPLRRKPGRLSYHLATLRWAEGKAMVTPVSSSSSGDVFSLVRANSFIVEPGGFDSLAAGAEVDVLPWID